MILENVRRIRGIIVRIINYALSSLSSFGPQLRSFIFLHSLHLSPFYYFYSIDATSWNGGHGNINVNRESMESIWDECSIRL